MLRVLEPPKIGKGIHKVTCKLDQTSYLPVGITSSAPRKDSRRIPIHHRYRTIVEVGEFRAQERQAVWEADLTCLNWLRIS